MKKLLLLLLIGLVLSGCVQKDYYKITKDKVIKADGVCNRDNWLNCYTFEDLEITKKRQDQRWEMLKEYLGVVEFTENAEDCFVDNQNKCKETVYVKEIIPLKATKTYLTDDPLKKEWLELECEEKLNKPECYKGDIKNGYECNYGFIRERCLELKEKL